jgi:putative SOS response-associated peptidase YedK
MDIIALTVLGFAIAFFMLYWFNRHLKSSAMLMQNNKDVQPLFKQKSAGLKYKSLQQWLKGNTAELEKLEQLHQQYNDEVINIDAYHDALTDMEQQHITH